MADRSLGVALELLQHQRRQIDRAVLRAGGEDPVGLAHLSLEECGGRVADALQLLGVLADDRGAVAEAHDRRGDRSALEVRDDDRLAGVVDAGNGRKGGSEVDADGFHHGFLS